MKKIFIFVLSLILAFSFTACNNSEDEKQNNNNVDDKPNVTNERVIKMVGQKFNNSEIKYPDELWNKPDFEYCTDLDFGGVGDVKGIFITSPIMRNEKKTKIAGYIGFPNNASKENKVPAIVLVHGGLGTAFPDWVKYWNDLGYAAISIDTEGGEPTQNVSNYNGVHKEENRYKTDEVYTNGPTNKGFTDMGSDITQSWFYHATSAVIIANSLLCSFEEVDIQRVGITGISWGGMITTTVIQYDDRFSFAMPVYGSMSLIESSGIQKNVPPVWDTIDGLKNTSCKTFFVNSMFDPHFSMDATERCAETSMGNILLKQTFPHGQEYGAYEPNLPFFADSFCKKSDEFVKIVKHPTKDDPVVAYEKNGKVNIDKLEIVYTNSDKINIKTVWNRTNVDVSSKYDDYFLDLPKNAKYCFVHITYNTNLEVSSYLIKMN